MMGHSDPPDRRQEPPRERERPRYEPPRVLLYSEEELLERLGPAKACSSYCSFGSFGTTSQDAGAGRREFEFDL